MAEETKEDMIRPDKKQAVIVSLSTMAIVLAVICVLIYVTDLGFLTPFKFLADLFEVNLIIVIIITAIIIGIVVLFIIVYIGIKTERTGCILNENSLTLITSTLMVLISKSEIPYDRIVKVTKRSNNFISGIFNIKSLVFELNGMNNKELTLPSIKNPDEAIARIIEKINMFRARVQQQVYEQDRINNILDMRRV